VRAVWEYNVCVETSVGRVEGVLWSDGRLSIGSPLVPELDRDCVSTVTDIAMTLDDVGLREGEANAVAKTILDGALGAFPDRFANHFAKPS
jgi:hypothetical protein